MTSTALVPVQAKSPAVAELEPLLENSALPAAEAAAPPSNVVPLSSVPPLPAPAQTLSDEDIMNLEPAPRPGEPAATEVPAVPAVAAVADAAVIPEVPAQDALISVAAWEKVAAALKFPPEMGAIANTAAVTFPLLSEDGVFTIGQPADGKHAVKYIHMVSADRGTSRWERFKQYVFGPIVTEQTLRGTVDGVTGQVTSANADLLKSKLEMLFAQQRY